MGSQHLFDGRFWVRFGVLSAAFLALRAIIDWWVDGDGLDVYDGIYCATVIAIMSLRPLPHLHRVLAPYCLGVSAASIAWWVFSGNDGIAGTALMMTGFTIGFAALRVVDLARRGPVPRSPRAYTTEGDVELMVLPMPYRARTWAVFSADRPVPMEDMLGFAASCAAGSKGTRFMFVVELQDGQLVIPSGRDGLARKYLEDSTGTYFDLPVVRLGQQ